jgi:hypothetical protein
MRTSDKLASLFALSTFEPTVEEIEDLRVLASEVFQLEEALKIFRSLVKEGEVPRYTVLPGAALNMTIEDIVDPALRRSDIQEIE